MPGIETVTLLAYVGFVLRLCMQYVGNGQARKGRSMELGGVREGGATTIGTAAAPSPNGTSTSAGIGTSAADPNGTSTSAGIGTSTTPGGDVTSSLAAGNDSSRSAEPHDTTFSPTA
jgi:hypothetical protein